MNSNQLHSIQSQSEGVQDYHPPKKNSLATPFFLFFVILLRLLQKTFFFSRTSLQENLHLSESLNSQSAFSSFATSLWDILHQSVMSGKDLAGYQKSLLEKYDYLKNRTLVSDDTENAGDDVRSSLSLFPIEGFVFEFFPLCIASHFCLVF